MLEHQAWFFGVLGATADKAARSLVVPPATDVAELVRAWALAAESIARPDDDPNPQVGAPTMGQLVAAIVGNALAAAEAERKGSPAAADRLFGQARVELDRARSALTGSHSVRPVQFPTDADVAQDPRA